MDTAASVDGAPVPLQHDVPPDRPITNATARKVRAVIEAKLHGSSL
jgi:hypothetical protein